MSRNRLFACLAGLLVFALGCGASAETSGTPQAPVAIGRAIALNPPADNGAAIDSGAGAGAGVAAAQAGGAAMAEVYKYLTLSDGWADGLVKVGGDKYIDVTALNLSNLTYPFPNAPSDAVLNRAIKFMNEDGSVTVPDASDEELFHAMAHRGIPTMACPAKTEYAKENMTAGYFKVRWCYDEVQSRPLAVYFSPASKSILVEGNIPGWGPIVVIFNAVIQNGQLAGFGQVITVLIDKVDVGQARLSSCASVTAWPYQNWEVQYEPNPPFPGGQGRCLKNGNGH